VPTDAAVETEGLLLKPFGLSLSGFPSKCHFDGPVEALSFVLPEKKMQPFDKLRANGV